MHPKDGDPVNVPVDGDTAGSAAGSVEGKAEAERQARQQRWMALESSVAECVTDAAVEGFDVAELIACALTRAAANRGDVEVLLQTRSGSWEAGLVRHLVNGTATEQDLPGWRSRSIEVHVDVEEELFALGLEDAHDCDLEAEWALVDDELSPEAARTLAQQRAGAIEALWADDVAEYRHAFAARLDDAARERGFAVGVKVVDGGSSLSGDWLEDELLEAARARTAVPATGAAPTVDERGFYTVELSEHQTYAARARRRLAEVANGEGGVSTWPVK